MSQQKNDVSFDRDIRPLFREEDVDHMAGMGVLLDDYAWMSDEQNARRVHDFLTGNEEPRMPPGGPYWSEENLTLLSDWIAGGCKP